MTSTKAAAQDAARAAAAAKKAKISGLNTALTGILTAGLKGAAMAGLKYVAGLAYEGNRTICDDPNTRVIEKTFCMVMKGLSETEDEALGKNIDAIANTLNEVNAKVTQIHENVKALLKQMDLVHLEIAEAVVGAEAYASIQAIQLDYGRFIKSIRDLRGHSDAALAYYTEVITETKLQRRIDSVFNALISGVANKDSLLGNIMQQIETKGADDGLLISYRVYEEYVNSLLLDLRKGDAIVSSALLYFEMLRQNGKLTPELAQRLALVNITNQSWREHWKQQIDTLLDHFNLHFERFAINRAVTPGEPLDSGPQPSAAQGINPFFFPEDAREAFRAADGFCSIQQENYGLRGRVFSMGGQFKGTVTFKDGSQAAASKTATLRASQKSDYWTADQTGIYTKVEFSDQWTVHRFHIPGAAAGKTELNSPLPYKPPVIDVVKCDQQTLQPSSAADAAAFGSFVEIARAGGSFAFLSGAWNSGHADNDDSNTTDRKEVAKVEELRDVPEFKIRHQQVVIGKIGRPEVGLRKGGQLHHNLKSNHLEGRFRTWLEMAKTIELPATSADEHINLVWSVGAGHRQSAPLGDAAKLNKMLRGPEIRITKPKEPITDAEAQTKPFILGVNFDPSVAVPDQGCRLYAGVRLYPVWDGQNADAPWHYPAIRGSALAGRIQVGVFREGQIEELSVSQILIDVHRTRKMRFRFEAFYDSRVETSGLELTPFVIYTQAELENAYVELKPGPGGTPMAPGEISLQKLLNRPAAECFSFDYDQNGIHDHVVLYDAGFLMAYGQVGSARFDRRPLIWGGDHDWELKSAADRVFEFDYDGSGKRDHLVFYRPGEGKISIMRNNHGVMETVWRSTGGLPGFNLKDAKDRGFAFDFSSKGTSGHLLFYRPGQICIWAKKGDNDFGLVYRNNGLIGDYSLQDSADRIFAYDHEGKGCIDHLVLYRPGTGRVSIVKPFTFNTVTNYEVVFTSQGSGKNGIGGYDLMDKADRGLAFDCDGTGRMEYLVFYRPNRGAIFIMKKNDQGTFNPPVYRYNVGGGGPGIASYDLKNPADRILAFDYNGTGQSDHLMLYRPGAGVYYIVKQKDTSAAPDFVKI